MERDKWIEEIESLLTVHADEHTKVNTLIPEMQEAIEELYKEGNTPDETVACLINNMIKCFQISSDDGVSETNVTWS